MSTPRRDPFIWATWLTKILAGDQSCEWSTWFKAHFSDFEKQPRENDLVAWTARHGEMVRKRSNELRAAALQTRGSVCRFCLLPLEQSLDGTQLRHEGSLTPYGACR